MPGPSPKPANVRQRRNRASSRSVLPAEDAPIERRPRLPNHPLGEGWHPMATRWWTEVWESPVRHELLRADLGALFRLVALVDRYWRDGSLAVAREIRLMEREFGLTPLSRRRLEWTVAQAEEAKDKHNLNRSRRARVIGGDDPRGALE